MQEISSLLSKSESNSVMQSLKVKSEMWVFGAGDSVTIKLISKEVKKNTHNLKNILK